MTAQARFHLHANGPFDHAAVMANLSSHAVTGLHDFDATTQQFSRWINISGTQQWVQLKLADDGVLVTTDSPDSSINSGVAARVKHWFDLDTDLSDINAHLRRDDIFSQQVKERPGIRIVRHQAPFEGGYLGRPSSTGDISHRAAFCRPLGRSIWQHANRWGSIADVSEC